MSILPKRIAQYWHSPGAMTAFSVVGRATGMALPLVALYYYNYPPTILAYWLLLTTIQSIVGGLNGTLPTVSMQMLSYAQAGSKNLFGSMDDHQIENDGQPNRGMTAHINRALVRIYNIIQAIWIGIAVIFGTAIIWSSLMLLPSISEGVFAWCAFIILATLRLRMQPFVAYLFAVGKTSFARRLEGFAWLGGSAVTTLSLMIYGNVAFAIFCLYAPVIVQFVIARKTAKSLGWEDDCPERVEYADQHIVSDIWPRAWRGSLGILAGMITLYGGGFIFAQYGDAKELAGYLLAINVLGILQQIAVSPLYGALPAMATRFAGGQQAGLFMIVDHVMRRSNWVYGFLVVSVPVGLYLLRVIVGIDIEFVSLFIWTALCGAGFILRYGGGHLHFYTLTNNIILHWVNGLLAVLYLMPLLIIDQAPLMYFPAVQTVAALCYAAIARYLTRQRMHYPLRRDTGFTLAAFASMISIFYLMSLVPEDVYL